MGRKPGVNLTDEQVNILLARLTALYNIKINSLAWNATPVQVNEPSTLKIGCERAGFNVDGATVSRWLKKTLAVDRDKLASLFEKTNAELLQESKPHPEEWRLDYVLTDDSQANEARKQSDAHFAKSFDLKEPYLDFGNLERVKELLKTNKHVAITGIGGVGKSALARKCAREFGDEFPFRFFLRAETEAIFKTNVLELAKHLAWVKDEPQGHGEQQRDPTPEALARFKAWNPPVSALLILDNLGDPSDGFQEASPDGFNWQNAFDYLPTGVKVLVTAQAKPNHRLLAHCPFCLPLDLLTLDQATEYLLKMSGIEETEAAEAVASDVAGLMSEEEPGTDPEKPVVFALACETVAVDVSVGNSNERLQRLRAWPDLLKRTAKVLKGSPGSRVRPFGIQASFEAVLGTLSPDAVAVLDVAAWLDAERMPAPVLMAGAGLDLAQWHDAMLNVVRRGILVPDGEWEDEIEALAKTYRIHRSHRVCLQMRQSKPIANDRAERLATALIASTSGPYDEREDVVAGHCLAVLEGGLAVPEPYRRWLSAWQGTLVCNTRGDGDKRLKAFEHLVEAPPAPVPWLDLSGTQVTDAGLKSLTQLTGLTTLDLSETKVTNAGLKSLTPLTRLTELYLTKTQVTDAGLKSLEKLTGLTALNLGYTQVTDAGLKSLTQLTRLTALNLGYTQVTDAGLKSLTQLTGLTRLYLGGTQVSDAGLKSLTQLTGLTWLYLSRTQVTDAGLESLTQLTGLTSLYLHNTQVTDAGLMSLTQLTGLTRLYLANTQVTKAGVDTLQKALPNCRISW